MTSFEFAPLAARARAAPRLVPLLILATSVVVLGSALLSQYVGGLQPCILCWYQRAPYALTIVVSALALLLARPMGARGLAGAAGVCALAFLVGAGIAAFHVGVEQHWWEGTSSCGTIGGGGAMTIEELRAQLLNQPVVRCDEIDWSMFGISMAGYNVLVSLGLAAGSLWAARALLRAPA